MTHRHTALVIAAGFFCAWAGILYAGADHPPPPGFVLIIIIDLIAACVVYVRVPTYIERSRISRRSGLLLAMLEGFTAGLVVALVVALIPIGGEPGVDPEPMAYVIWFAVLSVVGAVSAMIIYGMSVLLTKMIEI